MSKRSYTIESVDRTLRLLKLFRPERREISLAELSRLTNLNKSTIMRTMVTLAENDYVAYERQTQKYRLGIELFRLGMVVSEAMDIRKVAAPYIEHAAQTTGLVVHIGILERTDVVIVEKIWPSKYRDSIAMVSRVGGIVPVHCTGVGKALLAFGKEEEARRLLASIKLKRYSERTITEIDELMEELRRTRERGYAINDGEHEPYIKCYTMPIFDYRKQAIAAMSLTGLREVMAKSDTESFLSVLRETTARISKELGCPIGDTEE